MSEKMNCSKERTIRHFLMGFCLLCMMIMVTAVSSKAYAAICVGFSVEDG